MKRKTIMKILTEEGFTFKEDGKHTKILKDGIKVSVLSRQNEIDENIVYAIEKQTGIKLR